YPFAHVLLPGRQVDGEGRRQLAGGEAGVERPLGGRRILSGGDRRDVVGFERQRQAEGLRFADNEARVVGAADAVGRREVVEAAQTFGGVALPFDVRKGGRGRLGDPAGAGGGADLIANH